MAMTAKLRIRRKDLKKPDEFVSLTGRAVSYAMEHTRQLISILAVVVFLGGVAGLTAFYFFQNEAKAQLLLAQGISLYRQGLMLKEGQDATRNDGVKAQEAFENALKVFNAAHNQYPRTNSASISLLYAGNCHYQLGKFDAAAEFYNKCLSSSPHDELRALALYGLAQAYEGEKNYETALKYYTNLSETQNKIIGGIIFEAMARCWSKMGKPDLAKKVLEQGIMSLRDSPDESDRLQNLLSLIE